jgi:hypothetical protein
VQPQSLYGDCRRPVDLPTVRPYARAPVRGPVPESKPWRHEWTSGDLRMPNDANVAKRARLV